MNKYVEQLKEVDVKHLSIQDLQILQSIIPEILKYIQELEQRKNMKGTKNGSN